MLRVRPGWDADVSADARADAGARKLRHERVGQSQLLQQDMQRRHGAPRAERPAQRAARRHRMRREAAGARLFESPVPDVRAGVHAVGRVQQAVRRGHAAADGQLPAQRWHEGERGPLQQSTEHGRAAGLQHRGVHCIYLESVALVWLFQVMHRCRRRIWQSDAGGALRIQRERQDARVRKVVRAGGDQASN